MSIIIFLIILSALILVHEFGHFWTAKKSGIRVDEFGLGLPPRAKKLFSWQGTDFTLNWLPFGGFVKIFGENPSEVAEEQQLLTADSFQAKHRGIQAMVLSGGVIGNLLFAWLLLAIGLMIGLPMPASFAVPVEDERTVITAVLPNSPAEAAGLVAGDEIVGLNRNGDFSGLVPIDAAEFISRSEKPVTFSIRRGSETQSIVVVPVEGIAPDRLAVGVAMDLVGTAQLSPLRAIWGSLVLSARLTYLTALALITFILQAVVGSADLSTVTGPVGLVGMVGDVSVLGFAYLLSFTALISINLALINLVPFPALDGGRLLFVLIEAISRRQIPARVTNTLNTVGFAFLIFLMILITIRDVQNIF